MWNKSVWAAPIRVALLIVSTLFFAEIASAKVTKYQDWQVSCPEAEDKCTLFQALSNPDRPGAIYAVNVRLAQESTGRVVQINFPLGIYLPRGIGVSVGKVKKDIPMTVCLPSGCKAIFSLDKELLQALKKGDNFNVRFYTSEEKPNEIQFSLTGFADGYKALINE